MDGKNITGDAAAQAFAALGSPQRLALVRALVRAGPDGLAVGALGAATGIAASTLTHHLKALAAAGLIRQRRDGRSIACAADFETVEALSDFLLRECCADASRPHRDHMSAAGLKETSA